MTKYISFIVSICCLGCGKLEVELSPELEVRTESAEYKVGEEVTFHLTGEADNIIFYSGEPSNDYEYRNGRTFRPEVPGASLVFTSAVTAGSQANQLYVLV